MTETDASTIRRVRELQDWSQEAFARILGVSVRTVTRWETGVCRPSALALEKLEQIMRQDRSAAHERP